MNEETLDVNEFMNRVQNDKDLFFELLDIFVSDFQKKREELEMAVAQKDSEAICQVAHFLKGSCGNISAKTLRRLCVDLEKTVEENGPEHLEQYVKNIDQEFEQLVTCIGKLRDKL